MSRPIGAQTIAGSALLAAAVVLVAVNLRPAITSIGPLLPELRETLGASATWAGMLTTLPGLCFAAAGPAAPWLARRIGLRAAITLALVVLTGGLAVRVLDGAPVVIAGTLIATAGIALVNVLIPVVVKGSFAAQVGLMTGIYTAALQGGGALGAALTPTLDDAFGGWRPALQSWAVLAAAAAVVWLLATRGPGPVGVAAGRAEPGQSLLRTPLAWAVTVFFGSQSFVAYIVMGWLPEVFIETGMSKQSAGLLVGLISVIAVPISLVITPIAARQLGQSGWIVGLSLAGIAGLVGLMISPGAAPLLWTVLIGVGMSVFSLALTVIALRAHDPAHTAGLSGMAQGFGYLFAGVGPLLFGVLHDATGGWTIPWAVVLAVCVVQLVAGGLAGRNRHV